MVDKEAVKGETDWMDEILFEKLKEEFEKNPVTYSHEEVRKMLEITPEDLFNGHEKW